MQLKRFILDAKNRVDLTSLFSSKSKHADMLDTQEDMRNFFVDYQYEGMLQDGKKLKLNSHQNPNFYALMLLTISNVKDYDNWNNVKSLIKKQTKLDDFKSKEIKELNGSILQNKNVTKTSSEFICACGKFLCSEEMFKIYNIETKMSLWLGNTCIYKDKIASPKDLRALKQQKKYEAEKNYVKELSKERYRELNERNLMSNEERRQNDLSNEIIKKWEFLVNKYNKFSSLPYGIKLLIKIVKKGQTYITAKERKSNQK